MVAPNYPSSPTLGQQFIVGNKTFEWDGEKWRALSNADASLRSQLAATDSTVPVGGVQAGKINRVSASIKDLTPMPGLVQKVESFWAGLNLGGGDFVYNPNRSQTEHNGGTVIAASKISSLGNVGEFNNYFDAPASGLGCYERLSKGGVLVTDFGAFPSTTQSITIVLNNMDAKGFNHKQMELASGVFRVDNYIPLNDQCSFGGNANILIQSGHTFNVSVCERDVVRSDDAHSVMFTDVDWDWGTVAFLKSIGYNTVFTYGLFDQSNQILLLRSCIAAKSKMLAYSNSATASLPQLINNYQNVIGYYIYDEPDATGATIAAQDARINSYRTVTNKSLWCSLAIDSELEQLASLNFDVVMVQLYFGEGASRTKYDAGTVSRSNIARTLELYGSIQYKMPRSKVVPLAGLFTNSSFSNNVSAINQFAQDVVRLTPDGTFGVFVWGGQTDPGNTDSPKTNEELLLSAKSVALAALGKDRITITPVVFASDNDFNYASLDGILSCGRFGFSPETTNIKPLSVKNVGSLVDDFNSDFHEQGISAIQAGGYLPLALEHKKVSGVSYGRIRFRNQVNTSGSTVGLAITQDGGFNYTMIINKSLPKDGIERFWISPANISTTRIKFNLAIKFQPTGTLVDSPWKFLCGWLYCSNWPDRGYV